MILKNTAQESNSTAGMLRSIVVIPTYNEADNLPTLLAAIAETVPQTHILVVDDGSPDGTAEEAERVLSGRTGGFVLRRAGERGYGRASVDGFRFSLRQGYDFVLTMDADWSHDPKYLPQLLSALHAGSDLVVGSRYCNGVSVVNWPLHRVILSICANWYVRSILRLPVTDCTSGFRGYTHRALHSVCLDAVLSNGYAFLVEMLTRTHRARLTLREVPIVFVERRAGQSKMSKRVMLESVLLPWRLRLTRLRLNSRPLPHPSAASVNGQPLV